MSDTSSPQAAQILCIEHGDRILFTELIQVVQGRSLLWVRPLALRVLPELRNSLLSALAEEVYDLRQSVDLLLPATLFRPALDTEFIPLLVLLKQSEMPVEGDRRSRQQLQEFIQQLWQSYPTQFQPGLYAKIKY